MVSFVGGGSGGEHGAFLKYRYILFLNMGKQYLGFCFIINKLYMYYILFCMYATFDHFIHTHTIFKKLLQSRQKLLIAPSSETETFPPGILLQTDSVVPRFLKSPCGAAVTSLSGKT